MEEDRDGEDERYDPDSDMDLDDERYIFVLFALFKKIISLLSRLLNITFVHRKPLPGRAKSEFSEPEPKDMVLNAILIHPS